MSKFRTHLKRKKRTGATTVPATVRCAYSLNGRTHGRVTIIQRAKSIFFQANQLITNLL